MDEKFRDHENSSPTRKEASLKTEQKSLKNLITIVLTMENQLGATLTVGNKSSRNTPVIPVIGLLGAKITFRGT